MKKIEKILFQLAGISIVGLISLFIVTMAIIRKQVHDKCDWAIDLYREDCATSLINVVEHDEFSFRERNDAVWVLGQLADKKALPVLKKYYTGNIPYHESLDETLSQYELEKAIRWCEKGNATSWMYRMCR